RGPASSLMAAIWYRAFDLARIRKNFEGNAMNNATAAEANRGAGPIREGFAIDEAALARWLAENVEEFSGPLQVLQFRGGQSNPTYQLLTPGGSFVLRRKPAGPLAPGAHAVDREARVM